MGKNKPEQDGAQVTLPLVRGAPDEQVSVTLFVQTLAFALVHLFFILPVRLFFEYIVLRPFSPLVKEIGRPPLAHAIVRQVAACYDRWTPGQIRLMLDRNRSYSRAYATPEFQGWVRRVEVNGTGGRWLAEPGTEHKESDVVIYFVHGGGFIFDSGTNAQVFFRNTIKQLKKEHNVRASVFFLDYRLAPEYKYPSQLIETLAGYHYLVNTVGIPEDKIVLGGDSAGANLATAFLLHLARPSPAIKVPAELGPTPKRPAGALLISPYTNLFGATDAFFKNARFDILSPSLIARAAFAYIGADFPASHSFRPHGWNPLNQVIPTHKVPPHPAHNLPNVYGWSDIKNIHLFRDPYVNPFVCEDAAWWKKACPGEGKTLVSWGGKELFVDDDQALYDQLEKAGVEPFKLYHPLKLHDWLVHDYGLPQSHRVKKLGNELDDFSYGLDQTVRFVAYVIGKGPAPSEPTAPARGTSTSPAGVRQRAQVAAAAAADYSDSAVSSAVNGLKSAERQAKPALSAAAGYTDAAVKATAAGLRVAEGKPAAPKGDYSDSSLGAAAAGLRSAEGPHEPNADYSDPALMAAAVGLRAAEEQNKPAPASAPAPAATPAPAAGNKSKNGKGAAKKAAAGGKAKQPTGGSYATIAAHDDHIANNAPIVAEGEGDVIHHLDEE